MVFSSLHFDYDKNISDNLTEAERKRIQHRNTRIAKKTKTQ